MHDDITLEETITELDGVTNLEEFEAVARERLDPSVFAYIAGGAGREVTLRANEKALRNRRLRPRVLVDVSRVDPSTQILGRAVSMPVGLAPTALNRLVHPDGELAVARAAARMNVVHCLSTLSSCSIEEVAAAGGPLWFQLYVHRVRAMSEELVRRAAAAGCTALVLTVDLPVVGYREREFKHDLVPAASEFGNFRPDTGGDENLARVVDRLHLDALTWEDVGWIRAISELPLVIKGILTGEDARLAVEHGAAGIVVSNHGGRQLDQTPAAVDVLEEVVEAAGGRAEVYLDGGIRRGTDALIALALGATAVFVGRPYLYALAAGGERGVAGALKLVQLQLENAMALLGVRRIGEITRAHTF